MENENQRSSYSHILKYTGLFGGIQGLNMLIGLIRNKFVALLLGPDGVGLVALFNSTIKLFSDSTNLGISISAVKNVSEAYESGDVVRVGHTISLIRFWSLLTAFAGMILCVLLSPLINSWTFTWGDHTLHFILLSPVVALAAITGGELAILKGTRRLQQLAVVSVYNVIAALIISVPLYYFWREAAIIPSMIILAFVQMLIVIIFSFRQFPFQLSVRKSLFNEGVDLVRLGTAFVLAGILGSGAEFFIRSFLNTAGNLEELGLYNAGYMMTLTYAGMVFSALETDYFPRLSGVVNLGRPLNDMVNKQIEVSLLVISILLPFFLIFLPILLPLLYSGKFLPVLGMMKVTVLAMYIRAISLPIEYLSLSRGDSLSYLFLEAIYDILLVLFVIIGYYWSGLLGTGVAILLVAMVNLVVVLFYTHHKYGYSFSSKVWLYACIQIPLGLLIFIVSIFTENWIYWTAGILLSSLSAYISFCILKSKTHLWQSLINRINT